MTRGMVGTRRGAVARPAGLVRLAFNLARAWWPQLAALAAAAGVVAATVTGALGVGDSLARGLERVATSRLGGIRVAIVADEPIAAARALDSDPPLVPALVLAATVEAPGAVRRTAPATLLAADGLARLGFAPPAPDPGPTGIAVNEVLATALGVTVGDAVILRVAVPEDVPADLPLGRRDAAPAGRRLRVTAVLSADGIGQFALRPTQVTGGLAIVPLETAAALIGREGSANVLFAPQASGAGADDGALVDRVRRALHPTLDDFGLSLDAAAAGGVARLTTRRLVLPAEVDRAAAAVLAGVAGRPSLAFLAVEMTLAPAGGLPAARVPYSTVLGIDSTDLPVGPLVDDDGAVLAVPGDDEIIITRWAADDLAAQGQAVAPGAVLELRTFLPETLHGRVEERTTRLRVAAIAAQAGPAVARDLVPEVRGVTDEASIADWDPPFPFDRTRVRSTPPDDIDDRYWKLHGAAPKAFVSLATARRLAGSRFGQTTAWHLPAALSPRLPALRAALAAAIDPAAMGITVVPLRAEALAAARGSTPFGGLFVALSAFVVAAGLILEGILFSLVIAAHRRDVGLLAALGFAPRRLAALMTAVAAVPALIGTLAGVACGPPWTRLLLAWLGGAWQRSVAAGSGAIFGTAGIGPTTLSGAALVSALLSLAALAWGAYRAARRDPLGLLRGTESAVTAGSPRSRRWIMAAALALTVGAGLAWRASKSDAAAAVGLFFLAGVACLVGFLLAVRARLARLAAGRSRPLASLVQLADRGLAHAPGRAFAVAAMVAVAEFLVVAVSAFRLDGAPQPGRDGPTGGWSAIATLGAATSIDPSDPLVRSTLGLPADEAAALEGCEVALLRSSGGDDASCTNLYASVRPVVHGVGSRFIARGGFRFAATVEPSDNPWRSLEIDPPADGPLPAILDAATAQWALKLGGVGAEFSLPDSAGSPVRMRIVGLLEPGILQGAVLVSEKTFGRLFPRASGYRLALARAAEGVDPRAFAAGLATAWADVGAVVEPSVGRLARLQAVQNVFLAGFQALGALGLLLGTAGVAAVQIQGVVERSASFGLLGALGFGRGRVGMLVLLETLLMVALGLAAGALAAAVALPRGITGGAARLSPGWIALTCLATLTVAVGAGWLAARRAMGVAPRAALGEG